MPCFCPSVVATGPQAAKRREELDIVCPIQHGNVTDWEAMEKIWEYLYTDCLKVCECVSE